MRCFDGVIAVVNADNDAHGKYLLSFKIVRECIINGGGDLISLAGIFFENGSVLSATTGVPLSKSPYQRRNFTL